jgi:hypothetical protein
MKMKPRKKLLNIGLHLKPPLNHILMSRTKPIFTLFLHGKAVKNDQSLACENKLVINIKKTPVHHQGLRLSLGAFRTSPVESLYVEANEPSLENRRIKLGMQYATKLKAYPSNPANDCF